MFIKALTHVLLIAILLCQPAPFKGKWSGLLWADSLRVPMAFNEQASPHAPKPLATLKISYKKLRDFGVQRTRYRGSQALLETEEGWPFMLKLLIDEPYEYISSDETIESYEIAQRKLGKLVCDFIFITLVNDSGSEEMAIIMRKVKLSDLTTQLQEAVDISDINTAKQLIRRNVELIFKILKRGVFLFDAKFTNFGLIEDEQIFLDPGHISEKFDYTDAILKFNQIIQQNSNYLLFNLNSEELNKFYNETLKEFGLDESNIKNTLQVYFGIDSSVRMPDISEELAKSLGISILHNSAVLRKRLNEIPTDRTMRIGN